MVASWMLDGHNTRDPEILVCAMRSRPNQSRKELPLLLTEINFQLADLLLAAQQEALRNFSQLTPFRYR